MHTGLQITMKCTSISGNTTNYETDSNDGRRKADDDIKDRKRETMMMKTMSTTHPRAT